MPVHHSFSPSALEEMESGPKGLPEPVWRSYELPSCGTRANALSEPLPSYSGGRSSAEVDRRPEPRTLQSAHGWKIEPRRRTDQLLGRSRGCCGKLCSGHRIDNRGDRATNAKGEQGARYQWNSPCMRHPRCRPVEGFCGRPPCRTTRNPHQRCGVDDERRDVVGSSLPQPRRQMRGNPSATYGSDVPGCPAMGATHSIGSSTIDPPRANSSN